MFPRVRFVEGPNASCSSRWPPARSVSDYVSRSLATTKELARLLPLGTVQQEEDGMKRGYRSQRMTVGGKREMKKWKRLMKEGKKVGKEH